MPAWRLRKKLACKARIYAPMPLAAGGGRAVVRGRGQRLEEAFRELLLLGRDRLRAGDGRGAALRRTGEAHGLLALGKAEGHEEGRVVDLERKRLAVRR